MDRLEYLQRALPTWLACPEVDEVVLVDWSSRMPLSPDNLPRDERIKIVRVDGQSRWVLTKCCNLGIAQASGDRVLRLDADDLLDESFVRSHPHRKNNFYCADLSKIVRVDDVHLSGVVYAPRPLFLEVGGYNERLLTYGCDDDDLVARMRASGALSLPLDFSLVEHIPHGNDLRVGNQDVELRDEYSARMSWLYQVDPVHRSVEHNKQEIAVRSWSKEDKMTMWKTEGCGRRVRCEEMSW
jgi:hypothetical protein